MNVTMVIPTYWGRESENSWKDGDAVYDHPTPIDGEGTLLRTLQSIQILNNKNFKLVILVCPTCDEVEDPAELKVREIVKQSGLELPIYVFTEKNLKDIKHMLSQKGLSDRAGKLLQLRGYSNVRNICLYVSHLLGADVTMLIDDDELFEKPEWVDMALEFMGKRIYGKNIFGMAGYYLNKYDEFYDDVDIVPWMTYFNRFGSKTKAFDKIIASEPRVKVTPFAFGGAMVIHKNLYQTVPFDPEVTRGEDTDYVINAKMFGFDFFLDNKLSIKHLPPKKNHPIWKRLREDIYRFLYNQAKIRAQYEVNNMNRVTAEDFDPYPGDFMKADIQDKIYKTNVLLALEYLADNNIEGCKECLKNIYLSEYEAIPRKDPFTEYRIRQKDWVEIVELTIKERPVLRPIMESNNLRRSAYQIDHLKYDGISDNIIIENFKHFEEFAVFDDAELAKLAAITKMRAYNDGDVIFRKGSKSLELQLVINGSVRIVNYNDKQEEIHLANITCHGVIGETFMVKSAYSVTGIANEFTELLILRKEDLIDIINEDPGVGNKLWYMFMSRLHQKLDRSNQTYTERVKMDVDLERS